MDNKAQIEKVVIINDVNEALTVSSLQIAEHFDKQHKDVLKAITNLIKETSAQNCANLFYESTYPDSYGRLQKYYECTRDGFSLPTKEEGGRPWSRGKEKASRVRQIESL